MELLDYQRRTGTTWRKLAKQVGVPHSNLNAIAHGKRDCSATIQRQIEDETGGAVTPNDINRARRRYLDSVRPAADADKGVAS